MASKTFASNEEIIEIDHNIYPSSLVQSSTPSSSTIISADKEDYPLAVKDIECTDSVTNFPKDETTTGTSITGKTYVSKMK